MWSWVVAVAALVGLALMWRTLKTEVEYLMWNWSLRKKRKKRWWV